MNASNVLMSNLPSFFEKNMPFYTYLYDKENRLIQCNSLEVELISSALETDDFINCRIEDLFKGQLRAVSEVVSNENLTVLQKEKPLQFYNTFILDTRFHLDLLTIKMPVYSRTGKLAGVLGISQCLGRFNFVSALENGLTRQETKCLYFYLNGFSAKMIAQLMRISNRTVESYLEQAKGKLGCRNKSQLITAAYKKEITSSSIINLKNTEFTNGENSNNAIYLSFTDMQKDI